MAAHLLFANLGAGGPDTSHGSTRFGIAVRPAQLSMSRARPAGRRGRCCQGYAARMGKRTAGDLVFEKYLANRGLAVSDLPSGAQPGRDERGFNILRLIRKPDTDRQEVHGRHHAMRRDSGELEPDQGSAQRAKASVHTLNTTRPGAQIKRSRRGYP
jgi:hypothetical protein